MSSNTSTSAPPSIPGLTAPLVVNVAAPAAAIPPFPAGSYRPHVSSHEPLSPAAIDSASNAPLPPPYQPLASAHSRASQPGQPSLDTAKVSLPLQSTGALLGLPPSNHAAGPPAAGGPSATTPRAPSPAHVERYSPLLAAAPLPSPSKILAHLPHVASAPSTAAIGPSAIISSLVYDPLKGMTSDPVGSNSNAVRRASTDGLRANSEKAPSSAYRPPLQHFPTAPTSPAPTAASPTVGPSTPPAAAPLPTPASLPANTADGVPPTGPPVTVVVYQPPRPVVLAPRPSLVVGSSVLQPPPPGPHPGMAAALSSSRAPQAAGALPPTAAPVAASSPPPCAGGPMAGAQPAPASVGIHDRGHLRDQAEILHDLVGGKFDLPTCEDVLAQVGGDLDRAAHVMLDEYGGGDDGGGGVDDDFGADCAPVDTLTPSNVTLSKSDGLAGGDAAACAGPSTSTSRASAFAAAVLGAPLSQPSQPSLYEALAHHRLEPTAVDGTWFPDTVAFGDPTVAAQGAGAAGGLATGDNGGRAKWDGCAATDPWVTSDAFASDPVGGDGSNGCGGGRGLEVEAEGCFAPDVPPQQTMPAAAAAVATFPESGGVLASPDALHSLQDAAADADDGWIPMTDLEGDTLEEHLEEMRIYFPQLEDSMLRSTLEAHSGNVQQALQMLSELYEEEIYHKIDRDRQAEADAELARKLAEQQGSSPHAAYTGSSLGLVCETAAEDYVVGSVADVEPQVSRLVEAERRALAAPAGASVRSSRERWGLKLLVHLFGPEVDEGVLEAVLATHNGDVDVARATLQGMGLTESQQPQPQPGPHAAAAADRDDPWATAAAWNGTDADAVDSTPLMSRRCAMDGAAARGSGSGSGSSNLAAALRAASGSGSGPSRRLGTTYQGEPTANAAALGVPRSQGHAAAQVATGSSASCAAAATTTVAATGGSGGGGNGSCGPIRLLAMIGINFMDRGYLPDTLECIRVAFTRANVLEPLQQRLENAEASGGDQRLALGRPGGGLSHEEKQALWGKHRELPLALKAMRDKLRMGAQATYESGAPGSKRLARELKEAAYLVDAAIREQHRKASDRIYAGINAALQQEWKTDLHALLPEEALEKLDDQLQKLCFMRGNVHWVIITGKGLHSRGDGPKLPAMVDEWLARRGLLGYKSPGTVTVHLTPELCEQLIGYGPQQQQQQQPQGSGMSINAIGVERGLGNLSLGSYGT